MSTSGGDTVATIPEPAAIHQDVPCERCGYNVRGLTETGPCPECGYEVRRSAHLHRLRTGGLLPADPRWARNVREAAWLALAVLALMVLVQVVPREWFRMPFRNAPVSLTPGRVALLALACTWWALAWLSAWKLTARERTPEGLRRRRALVAVPARWLWTAYTLVPLVWAAAAWKSEYLGGRWVYPLVAVTLAGPVAALLLYVRIGTLLRRGGAGAAAVVAWLFAFTVPVGMLMFVTIGRRGYDDPSSLALMFALPVHAFGAPDLHEYVAQAFVLRRNFGEWPLWVFLGQLLISVFLFVRLLVLYRRSRIGDAVVREG